MEGDTIFTVEQTATILKVHPLSIRRYIKSGRLKALRIGGNIRIPQTEIDNFSKAVVPSINSTRRIRTNSGSKFSLDDPIFTLKGKGLSIKSFEI
jgi:excisionase family DNA binding protein